MNTKPMPTISIITPTFNSSVSIDRNLRSIISQSYASIEHIIVDNLSSDNTIQKIKDIYSGHETNRVKIISEKDHGIADAFNKGIQAASGDIIGILNSDDEYFHSNVLQKVAEAFLNNDTTFVHGDMYFVDSKFGSNIRRPLLCPLTYAMPYNHPTFFVRKELYQSIGLFDTDYRYAMDFELICRMYQSPTKTLYSGVYIAGTPMVLMQAGGASWENELKSIDELESALRKHSFWNEDARKALYCRKQRIWLKAKLDKMGALFLIKIWRKIKWRKKRARSKTYLVK